MSVNNFSFISKVIDLDIRDNIYLKTGAKLPNPTLFLPFSNGIEKPVGQGKALTLEM